LILCFFFSIPHSPFYIPHFGCPARKAGAEKWLDRIISLAIIPSVKLDDLVKSRNSIEFVIPAKDGIQLFQDVLDPGFRRGDALRDFLRDHQTSSK